MATAASSSEQAAELLHNFSLDSQARPFEFPDPHKKTSANQYPNLVDPTSGYFPICYPSYPFAYGGYDVDGNPYGEYPGFAYTDGSETTMGFYRESSPALYQNIYGFVPCSPYSPVTSPVPMMGNEGHLYGPQYCHSSPICQSLAPASDPFTPSWIAPSQGELSFASPSDEKPLAVEAAKGNSVGTISSEGIKENGEYQTFPYDSANNTYGRDSLPGVIPLSRYLHPGFHSKGNYKGNGFTSLSKYKNVPTPKRSNYCLNPNAMGYYHPGPAPRGGSPHGFLNNMYTNKFYGLSGYGFGSGGYGSKLNTQGWFPVDSKYKNGGHGNGYCGYCDENIDCLKELSKGPRLMGAKNQIAAANEDSSKEKDEKSFTPDWEQFNQADFPVDYVDAKFFVIKSYSEDDVHMCIKYNVWSSTPKGNKKLAEAYCAAQQNSGSCPVFLLFSVNASGHFVGLAEMVGPVDFDKNVEYWQDDKWTGCFPVKWHIVKDIPNNLLKHITLENNENKPITNSRDTQEVMLDHGLKIIKIFKNYDSKTCILDDFKFYELRHESVQEQKAKQQRRFEKQQLFAEKTSDEKKAAANESNNSLEFPSDLNIDPVPTTPPNGDLKPLDNSEAEGNLKMSQPITTSEKNTY